MLKGTSAGAGCTHYTTTVTPGQTKLYRIINAGTLVYQTICFEEHLVTIVAADGYATAPLNTTCVDINAGQRCTYFRSEVRADVTVGQGFWSLAPSDARRRSKRLSDGPGIVPEGSTLRLVLTMTDV